jgi:small neutral amino acid transporter SnatA (MarC family)
MPDVKVKVAPVAWPLVAASAIMVAAAYLAPNLIPDWLLLVPLVLIFLEAALTLPSSVLVAVIGVQGLQEQLKRLRKTSIYEEVLDRLADKQAEKPEESA